VEVGRQEKIKCIIGTVLPENYGMLALCKKLGFEVHRSFEDRVVEAKMNL
jgi:RimJ/RimL family protein N-acetyltransferase